MNAMLSWAVGASIAIVAFHFIIYPALIFILARLIGRPCTRGSTNLSVSLITPAYNEASVISRKIDNSVARARSGDEVIVVSDGSTDGTTEIIRDSAERSIRALTLEPRQGKVAALNHAVEHSTADILIFTDAKSLLAPDAVDKILRNFADPKVGCVNGALRMPPDTEASNLTAVGRAEGLYWQYEEFIKRHESLLHSTLGVTGSLLALRRTLWRKIQKGTVNDDVHIGLSVLRQGYRVIYDREAIAWQLPSLTTNDEMVRRTRMTAGRYQNLLSVGAWPWRVPGAVAMLFCHKFLRLLMPIFLFIAFVANIALLLFPNVNPLFVFILVGQVFVYGLAAVGAVAECWGRRWRLPSVAYYFVLGNIGTLVGLVRYVRGRQSVLWEKAARGADHIIAGGRNHS
ncbi:MAG: glycosyltransferase family 2 protein [Hyphomicrobiales bacterium]|nr:glycosyltransferase family 2 protein [Hyphomicrobiales bacterium]